MVGVAERLANKNNYCAFPSPTEYLLCRGDKTDPLTENLLQVNPPSFSLSLPLSLSLSLSPSLSLYPHTAACPQTHIHLPQTLLCMSTCKCPMQPNTLHTHLSVYRCISQYCDCMCVCVVILFLLRCLQGREQGLEKVLERS